MTKTEANGQIYIEDEEEDREVAFYQLQREVELAPMRKWSKPGGWRLEVRR